MSCKVFNHLYYLIDYSTGRTTLLWGANSLCNVIISRRYTSLQSAWDKCATLKNCEGVFEENCSANKAENAKAFFACAEIESGPLADGFNGCFCQKPSEF